MYIDTCCSAISILIAVDFLPFRFTMKYNQNGLLGIVKPKLCFCIFR